jgi:hypothetical protein
MQTELECRLGEPGFFPELVRMVTAISGLALAVEACIDPALSAQLMLLRRMPRQGFACSAPDEGAGGYKNRSNPR